MGIEMQKPNIKDNQTAVHFDEVKFDVLSDIERDDIAKKYEVNESSKNRISKRNGVVYFGELPIEDWFSTTSGNDNAEPYRKK